MLARFINPDGQQALVPFTVDGAADPHAYFEGLRARPTCLAAWSLRDQAQVDALAPDLDASTTWRYPPPADAPGLQDALAFTRINPPEGEPGHGKGSVPQHDMLLFPHLPITAGQPILYAWDQWWDASFRDNAGGIEHFKAVGIEMDGRSWWTNMQSPGVATSYVGADPGVVAVLTDEFQAGGGGTPMTRWERVIPSGAGTPVQYPGYAKAGRMYESRWTRFWCEIIPRVPPEAFVEWNATYGVTVQPNPEQADGTWTMVSKWMADEQRGVSRLLYRVPMGFRFFEAKSTRIRFTMDSSKIGFIGPWHGYVRNVAVLAGHQLPAVPETDVLLFQPPTA